MASTKHAHHMRQQRPRPGWFEIMRFWWLCVFACFAHLHLQSLAENYAAGPGRAPATDGRDLPLALHPPAAQGCCEPRVHGQGGRDVGKWAALAAKPL